MKLRTEKSPYSPKERSRCSVSQEVDNKEIDKHSIDNIEQQVSNKEIDSKEKSTLNPRINKITIYYSIFVGINKLILMLLLSC